MKQIALRSAALGFAFILAGCQSLSRKPEPVVEAPPPPPVIQAPVATHTFKFDPATDDVVGELQVTKVQGEDTFSDIARRFNLGYEELVRANPGVDPWLPGEGREIVLPTQYVLPAAPREGLVINLAQLRVDPPPVITLHAGRATHLDLPLAPAPSDSALALAANSP